MTYDEIKTEVEKAIADDRTLFIENYVTSDGVVKDYMVKLLPDSGYKDLVKESLEKLNTSTEEFMNEIRPADADMVEWATAVSEQIDSFSKTLAPDKEKKEMNFKNPLVKVGAVHVYQSEFEAGNISGVVLKNLQVLSSVVKSGQADEKLPKGNVAKYKHVVRSKLPIASYLGQLNLLPGKFSSVRSVHMS